MSVPKTTPFTVIQANAETLALHQIMSDWKRFNANYFSQQLKPPIFQLTHAEKMLGCWQSTSRTIAINRELLFTQPWGRVIEVLKHEMAHQYVSEILRVTEPPHGPSFQSICNKFAFDKNPQGLPIAIEKPEHDKVFLRVRKLLALAESTNVHEAEQAMQTAQILLLKHNLSLQQNTLEQQYEFLQLGLPKQRILAPDKIISTIITRFFFVEGLWASTYDTKVAKSGRVFEICGLKANIDMAEYVYEFLQQTAYTLWQEHKTKNKLTKNKDKLSFLTGVMRGFETKLEQQQQNSERQGLVWLPGAKLHEYFRKRNPYIRTSRYSGPQLNASYHQGKKAGENIVLHRPISQPSSSKKHFLK